MKSYWLKLLLLATFSFWGSGAAKYVHEALEHHGRDASVDDDDDDDDSTATTLTSNQSQPQRPGSSQTPAKKKSPCPICQMLAAMTVDRSSPPVVFSLSTRLIARLVLLDHATPTLHACYTLSARDPPTAGFVL
jgi:hypothetical protein